MINTPQTETTINQETAALIGEHIRRLLEVMGFEQIKVACATRREQIHIAITAGPAGRLLIGSQGAHLSALQHIIRSLIKRQLKIPLRITVDVNGYLASREKTLLHIAEEAARKAGRTGQTIMLPPMTAAGRRTIHTSLASRPDVTTESLGEEPNRRVVVRPLFV